MKDLINYDEFASMDLRVGHVAKCERKEGADKLLRLTVDFGEEGTRNILSSLYPIYEPEDLEGNDYIFILNLEPRKFLGEESQGMILCAEGEKPIPLQASAPCPAGATIH
jgi:methionyl-tRNA synthetase